MVLPLGQTGTEVLFGGDNVDFGIRSGARFTLGYCFTPCQDTGLEVTYLFLGNSAVDFNATSQTTPILALPFYNVRSFQQDSLVLAYPDQQTATIHAHTENELNSVDVLYRQTLLQKCDRELDFLIGYRYARFAEDLTIDDSTTYTNPVGVFVDGTIIARTDRFTASNEFHGAELGFVAKRQCCRWSLELLTKLALGNTQSRVSIDGSTAETVPPSTTSVPYRGGLYALPTNSVNYERNNFSVIPELGVTLGYDITCRLKATVGYTFMYWSQLARAGDQVDTNVNYSQGLGGTLSGIGAPQFKLVTTDFWAQGLNIGLNYRF